MLDAGKLEMTVYIAVAVRIYKFQSKHNSESLACMQGAGPVGERIPHRHPPPGMGMKGQHTKAPYTWQTKTAAQATYARSHANAGSGVSLHRRAVEAIPC